MSASRMRAPGGYDRRVWLLCLASALGAGSYLGMHQLLNALFVLRLGYGPEFWGTVAATGAFSFSMSCMLGGYLGTRLGPFRTLALGAVTYTLGMAMPPLTGALPAGLQRIWMLLAQVVISSGWSLQVVNVIAALGTVTQGSRGRGPFTLNEVFSSGGMLLGAAVGGMLPGAIARLQGVSTELPGPYALALWVAVAGGLANWLPIGMLQRGAGRVPVAPSSAPARSSASDGPRTQPRRRIPLEGILLLLAACGFATNAGHAACKTFATVYLDRVFALPSATIGAITSSGMCATALTALIAGRLGRRLPSGLMMIVGALGMALALLTMALWRAPAGAVLGLIGVFGVLGLWRPAYQSLQMEMARPEQRAAVSGLTSMSMSLGFGGMGLVGGQVVARAGYAPVFLAGTVAALISAGLAMILTRRTRRRAGQGGASDTTARA
ncbi:MAG: MFS transporter [Anaerolineae bacterium]|jgi:MFS family permease|nr:MFS transporter [Chloroflexota bacterium]